MSTACVPAPLSATQLKVLGALLAGRSPAETAREHGISPRTLRDWQSQPGFRAALVAGQSQLLQQTCVELASAASIAVHTLVEICQDTSQKGSVRVAAAGKLLDLLLRGTPQAAALAASVMGEGAPASLPAAPGTSEKPSLPLAAPPAAATSAPFTTIPEPELAVGSSAPDSEPSHARDLHAAIGLPRPGRPRPMAPSTRTSAPLLDGDRLPETRSHRSHATRIPTDAALTHSR